MHVAGTQHPDLRVAMREIDLAPSADEPPLRVYDTSGPYTDPALPRPISAAGLPELRQRWILARGDVEDYRRAATSQPEDNGLSRGEAPRVPHVRPRRPPGRCAPSPAQR